MIRRHADAVAYQSSQLTRRPPDRLLDELAALDVTGVHISERGTTYLMFAPHAPGGYTVLRAVTLAVVLAIADLVATAESVVWIALLPLALTPFIPLLFDDSPQLAVGAVPGEADETVTRITAHGRVWGDLGSALDAYLGNLPSAAVPAVGGAGPSPAVVSAGPAARATPDGTDPRTGPGDPDGPPP